MACPICDRPTDTEWRPFCSRRCADADLGRWLTGGYRLPAGDDDAPPPDAATDAPDDTRRH